MNTLPTTTLQKYSGTLVRMSRERTNQSFAPGEHDQQVLGALAVGAALVGAAGQAATLATVGSDPSEPADWVECELDEGTKFHGWLWRSPFKKGDEVEIIATTAAEGNDQRHRLFAMARPRDRLVALYPHCSRGRYAHWKKVFNLWLFGTTFLMLFVAGMCSLMNLVTGLTGQDLLGTLAVCIFLLATPFLYLVKGLKSILVVTAIFLFPAILQWNQSVAFLQVFLLPLSLIMYAIFALPALHLGWKWMEFVRVAEQVFTAFGWPDVKHIDLVARSKATPLNCKESNIREHDIGLTASSLTTSADYTAGFYRY